jgi:hypothetical protein
MWFIAIFVVGGVAFGTVRAIVVPGAAIIAFIAGAIIIAYGIGAAMWFNDHTGVSAFLVHTWQLLSGVSGSGEIIVSPEECSGSSEITSLPQLALYLVVWLGLLALALCNVILGLVAVIGLPLGIIFCAVCAIRALFSLDFEALAGGVVCLLGPLGCAVLVGLIMRLMHTISPIVAGC